MTTVRNLALNARRDLREHSSKLRARPTFAEGSQTPWEHLALAELQDVIRDFVLGLTERRHRVFLLTFVHGYTTAETAEFLRVALGSQRRCVSRECQDLDAPLGPPDPQPSMNWGDIRIATGDPPEGACDFFFGYTTTCAPMSFGMAYNIVGHVSYSNFRSSDQNCQNSEVSPW
jgi:hypothetical protein